MKGENQHRKLFYIVRILMEKTDDSHGITMPEIIKELEKYDITAERKSVYEDLRRLEDLGIDVISEREGKGYLYRIGSRQFELAELKLLVDAIQSSKFITENKSRELIGKIETLCSEHDAKKLHRQVFVSGRIKTDNEAIYYNVDAIHHAISDNKKITFIYTQWNAKGELVPRKGGKVYDISPWALSWDDENYYLVGYDSEEKKIKHYRVDKIRKIHCSEEEREGKEYFEQFDMAAYAKKNFSMYGGEEIRVKLLMKNELAGVAIDRFGKRVTMIPYDDAHFTVNVNVYVSDQFIAWVFALGEGAKIIGPEPVVEKAKAFIKRLMAQYQ